MSLVMRKSSPVVVRPSPEPGTTKRVPTIKLSSFDKGLYNMPTTTLLVFEHPLDNAAETIRGALSRALSHYYPIAGRIVASGGDNDDVYIDCNDEGVAFVAASADHAPKEVTCFDRSPGARKLLDELAAYYPAMSSCGAGDPLLLMQVTEFSCGGGFVLGVTWNHGVADGAGMGQFLRAVGELAAAAGSPSVAPVRWDPSLPSLPPRVLEAQRHMLSLDPLTDDLAVHDINIPVESINNIKADFSSSSFHGQQPPCTTFEAALAVLWRCRTRAIRRPDDDPATPVMLMFVADVRRHAGAKGGYYGNCIVEQFVVAESGVVADGEFNDVVMAVRRAKDRIPELLKEDDDGGGVVGVQEMCKVRSYDTLTVTSWRNLGFDLVDFGSGRPARVTGSGKDLPPSPGAVGFTCDGRGGVSVLSALVREEHADAFLAELAKFT
ncbi:unnamed protein product [Urochloa decumbens]|uniref:Uncharacterized protein n=1 Tax=Urochloa decumbens TaxID=240449 RepID=A0ABC9FS03_9POAL